MAKTTSQIVAENKKKREEERKISQSRDAIHQRQMKDVQESSKAKTKSVLVSASYGTKDESKKKELERAFFQVSGDRGSTEERKLWWLATLGQKDEKELNDIASKTQDPEKREFVQNMAANARVQRLRNMDITMAQTDIGQLRRDRDRLYYLALESVDWTDSASRKHPDEVKKKYDSQIAKLETEINQARRYQKEAELSAVGDRNSQNYDPEFAQRAQFRGNSERSRYINDPEAPTSLRNPGEHPEDYITGKTDYSQFGYALMSQEQRDIYNYWDSYDQQNGTDKATEYLDSIAENLQAKMAIGEFDNIKDKNALKKMAFYVGAGAEGGLTGIGKLYDLFTGSERYTPASSTQIAANMLMEQDRQKSGNVWGILQDEENSRKWSDFWAQNAMSAGNMIPSAATGLALNLALPGLGVGAKATAKIARAGSLAVMGAGIAGNTYTEAINQGYSPKNAKAYAYANAASEIGTELLFGGIEGMTGIGTDMIGDAILKKTDNAILRAGARGFVDGLGETVEEGFQAVIEPWMNNVILHKDEVLRGQDVAYNMLAGFATGFMMSGPSIALDEYGTYRTGKDALDQKIDVDTLRGIGESFDAGTEANRLAKKIDKNTGAYTIGRALNEIGAELGEQNVLDITRYLQNHGLPADVAENNAMVLNYIAMGGQLSEQQKLMVNENQLLADAVREVILDPDSKVNQRTNGLKKLMGSGETVETPEAAKIVSRRNENGDAALNNPNRAVLAVDSREGDTMQLRLKNGDVVDSSDMTAYHDEAEALLFETARKYSTDVGDANLIANGFESSNVSMEEYCKGVEDCYRYGIYGMNYSEVKRGSLSSTVDADAARSAYMAGIREANTRVARQQKAAMEARQPGQEAAVHFNRNGRKFDAKRETAISTMEQLSKALGVDFWVFESYEKNGSRVYADETGAENKAPNGWYDDNGIHIDLNAGNDGRGVMLYTLAHELTHHIRRYSPEKFKAFADVVMKGYGDRNISAENLIQEQIAKAKKNGRDISYDEAYEEMIADSMEGILADGKVLEKLKGLQDSDPSLWETVKQWAKDIAEKIRAVVDAYKGERMDSHEGRVVANMKEILPQLEELYAEGLADTRGTSVTDGDTGAKNAAQDGGVKYQARQVGYDYSKPFSQQVDDYDKGLIPKRDTLIVGPTPDVFLKIGFNALPMSINTTHVDYALNGTKDVDHNIGKALLKQLPESIKNPIAVFTSKTQKSTSLVSLLPFTVNGKQAIAPVYIDGFGFQNGIQIDSNSITSVFGKTNAVTALLYDAIVDESSGVFSLLYINKKEASSLLQIAGLQLPGGLSYDGFIHSIRESDSPVKAKYDNFTESQQFKRWFGDWKKRPDKASKVVNADGTPMVVYHQTSSDFTIFDPRHEGAGTRDSDTPFGIFLKSSDKDIGLKGGKQMALYASIKNPLVVQNRQELIQKLSELSTDYKQASDDLRNLNADYQQKFDDAKEAWRNYMVEWRKGHPDASRTALYEDEQFNKLFNAEDDVIDEWETEARKIETRSKDAITRDIEANGYDGIIIQQDNGSFGRSTDAYIALHPEQVKSATDNIGTFDGQNPDIRYSDRDPDAGKMNRILQKQNAELKDTVEYLRELVKLQGKVTDGTVYTWGSVEAAARRLMNGAGAKGDVVELRKILERTYKAMGEGSDSMTGLIDEAAQWIVEHQNGIDLEEDGAASMNVQRLNVWENFTKLVPIKTTADRNKAQVETIKQRYTEKIQSIRENYQSQIDQLKQQRREDVKAVRAEMQGKADAQQQAAKERFQQQKEDLKAARQDTQIMEREFLRIARECDKAIKAGDTAQSKADSLKAALEEEAKKHKQDNAMWEKEFRRLSREYDKADRNVDALQEKLEKTRASAKERVEGRKQTAIRNQLKDIHGQLSRMLTNPGKGVTAHAPTALTQAVADVCQMFVSNLEQAGIRQSGEYDARIEMLSGKLAENTELKYAQNGIDAAQRQKLRIADKEIKLGQLRQRYEEIKKDGALSIYYDEHTSQMLEALDKQLRGKDIYEMTSQELEAVKETMQSFYHSIVNANKIWMGDHNAELTETARQWGKEINDVNVGFIRKYLKPVGRYMNWQMSPDTMFMAFSGYAKNSVGEQVQKMFSKGTERMIQVQTEYYNQFSDIMENPQNRKELGKLLGNPTKTLVDVGLKDMNGNSVKITRGMALQLYMLLCQEDSRKALVYSGLKVPDQRMYYKDRSKAYGDKELNEMLTPGLGDSAYDLSRQIEDAEKSLKRGEFGGISEEAFRQNLEDMRRKRDNMVMGEEARLLGLRNTIEEMLTPLERQCIESGRKWYARSGELMADTHEEIHGYRPRLIEDYVPMHRNGDTVWTDIRDSNSAFNLENSGFLKERVEKRNAILLTDFFVELGSQRDAIARYCGYSKAQKDFSRLWKIRMPGMNSSVNEMIGAKFGKGNSGLGVSGVDYVENYIKDIAGGRESGKGLLDKFYGAAASASLSLNLRVAGSQLASIPTAAAAVGWKNMSVGFVKGLKTAFSKKAKNELAQKNAFFFQRYRGEGGITEVADLQKKNGLWNRISQSKAGKLLFNWCQNMDVFATSTMYAMAEEAAVSRGYKRGEAGFDEAANEIYTEIIRRTQPNYTVTERSDMLRDNRAHMKMFNMFKTQSNQNLNILMQASGKFAKMRQDFKAGRNGVTRADVKQAAMDLANAGTAVIIGGAGAFVLIRTAANLVWAQVKGYRDDETGEVTSDKIKEGMFQEFLSSIAGMFTLGDMAYDLIHAAVSGERYYGLTDSAVGAVGDALQDLFDLWQKSQDEEGWDEQERKKDIRRTIGSVFGAFGVPAENAMKFMDAYEHWVLNIQNGSLGNYDDSATTKAQYRNRFLNAYRDGDADTCNDILALLAVTADEPNERRAAIELRGGFRDSFKDKFLKGEVTEDEVRDIMVTYLDAEPEDVELMIAGWKGKQDTGMTLDEMQDSYLREKVSTEDYIQYLTKYQGKDQEKAEEAELRLRCERDTGYAYDEIKEAYMDEEITASDAAQWLGDYGKVKDPEKKLMEYDFEDETGYSWDDKRMCYLDGGVSKADFKRWLMDIDGKRSADADYYIGNLDFEKENGYAYNEKLEKYISGEITRQQLKQALMTKGGMFEAEADRELVAYDYIKNHPNTKLSISTAYSYTRKINNCDYTLQSAGFTEEQFLSFREKKNACNGTDNDGDGYRDSGSVQAQVLPIIDAMPISVEQKDTLWFFCGWSKKTLKKKAPWHTR